MPTPSVLAAFAAASFVLLVVPGPAVLFILARSSAQGSRAGFISVLGVQSASIVHVLAAVVGLSALVVASAAAFTAVKVLGGVYLIFLGVKTLLSLRAATPTVETVERRDRELFIEGFIVNLLNPKVALFFLAFLPQFIDVERSSVWMQTLVFGLLYIVIGIASDGVYALLGGHASRWALLRSKRSLRGPRIVEGSVLIGLGVLTLATPHRRQS